MYENEFAAEVAELVGIRNDYSMATLNQAAASNAPEG